MLKKILKISFYAAISTLAVISTVAVYAAFIAPSDTPSTSVQDWSGNVLGANSANNTYDSSSVVGNHDGSLLERAEDLRKTLADESYDSSYATADADGSVLQVLKDIKASLGGTSGTGCFNVTCGCYNVCQGGTASALSCSCTPDSCPSGYSSVGLNSYPVSLDYLNGSCYTGVMNFSRHCCK